MKPIRVDALYDFNRGKFLDGRFEEACQNWIRGSMRPMPLDMLAREDYGEEEIWQYRTGGANIKVVEVECTVCNQCGAVHEGCHYWNVETAPCCQAEHAASEASGYETSDMWSWEERYVVEDEDNEFIYEDVPGRHKHDVAVNSKHAIFEDSSAAEDFAAEEIRDRMSESVQFPYDGNTAYYPDERIPDELLADRFVVYDYNYNGRSWRLCGHERGSLEISLVLLYVNVHAVLGWTMPTERGDVLVTTDLRDPLVVLAEDGGATL